MRYYADLHVHSRYSRACSRNSDLPHLAWWARRKGITVLGTGDFLHPVWAGVLRESLVPAEPGLFRLRDDLDREVLETLPPACRGPLRFLLQVEVATNYRRGGRGRRIHHLCYAPGFDAAGRLARALSPYGDLASDGLSPPWRWTPVICWRPSSPAARAPTWCLSARLDALVRRPRLEIRLRRRGRVLRRPGRARLRAGDGPVLGPGDELAGLLPGPPPAGQPLGRALPAHPGPQRHRVRHRGGLLRGPPRAGDRRGVRRHRGSVPGGGQVPPGRAPRLRSAAGTCRDQGARRQVPGVRQEADRRCAPPGRGAGRPSARAEAVHRRRGPEDRPAAGDRGRDPGRRAEDQVRRARPGGSDRRAGPGAAAAAPGAGAPGARGGRAGGGRGDRAAAHPPGAARARLRRRVRLDLAVRPRGRRGATGGTGAGRAGGAGRALRAGRTGSTRWRTAPSRTHTAGADGYPLRRTDPHSTGGGRCSPRH
ncbi:hypothetical protein LUW77_04055 [Streptomyces radiopugnans]|nr:hypothetical protein LUW77_04055 [Streptomyces radiopugnans]